MFSIYKEPYNKKQHPNQQNGLDMYIDVVDHYTGYINTVKLYENSKGNGEDEYYWSDEYMTKLYGDADPFK